LAIAVFGISGRTGMALVEAAQVRGLELVGLARRPLVPPLPGHVRVQVGELSDAEAVRQVVAGSEAVICVVGPRPPHREVFCAAATGNIIAAMRAAGVTRLLCQTGAMVGALPGNVSLTMRWMAHRFARSRPEVAADRDAQEQLVRASRLDWTLVKPPRLRTGAARSPVRAGPALSVGLLASISRSALAGFLLDEVTARRFAGQAVYVRD